MQSREDTTQAFGAYLQELRIARGVSLRRLAKTSGVSARTLSYWEAGKFEPRVPEMEAALRALSVSPTESRHALTLLHAPRAVHRWREATGKRGAPSTGDLLRAMRHRRRARLEQTAAALGISAATLSRWEQGKVAPPADQLDRLLDLLNAAPGERAAVLRGPMLSGPAGREPVLSVGALREEFDAFAARIYGCMEDPLHDLHFLTFTAEAWPFARESAAGRLLLAEVHARHASYLASFHRYAEAERYAEQALDLMPDPRAPEPLMLRAAVVYAEARAYRGASPAPGRGLEILEAWRAAPARWGCYAWLLADMAAFMALAGNAEAAMALSVQACRAAETHDNADSLRVRRLDLARLYTRLGRGEEALSLTRVLSKDTPFRRADVELLLAEEYLAVGDMEAAGTHAERAETVIHMAAFDHLQPRLTGVKTGLEPRP